MSLMSNNSTSLQKLSPENRSVNVAGNGAVLASHVIPAAPRSCLNCKTPMQGPFCYQCGQHERVSVRHFGLLLRDIIHDVFEMDSRLVRTLKPLLFRPGFLTIEYFAGRRQRYVPPLRLYVISSLLFFLLISLMNPMNNGVFNIDGDDEIERPLTPEEQAEVAQALNQPGVQQALKMTGNKPEEILDKIKEQSEAAESQSPLPPTPSTAAEPEAKKEKKKDDGIRITLLEPQPWLPDRVNRWLEEKNKQMEEKAQSLRDDPGKMFDAALSVLPQSMFIALPLFALFLKFSYPFSGRYYIEHLMVAFHSHSFMFVTLVSVLLLTQLETELTGVVPILPDLLDYVTVAALIWIPIYLLIMQKQVYGQGWMMTLFKYHVIGLAYIILLSFTIAIDLVIGLLNS